MELGTAHMENPKVLQKEKRHFRDEDALALYLREISRTNVISVAEEKKLLQRMAVGDKRAMNELIMANLRFVVSVCRQFQNQGMPLSDLISEGNLGLLRAAETFDPTRNCRFMSYAVWWVRQRILAALAEQSKCFTMPVGKFAAIRKIAFVRMVLEQRLGRRPTNAEIAVAVGGREKQVEDLLSLGQSQISLESSGQDGDPAPMEFLSDPSLANPEENLDSQQIRKRLHQLLDGLKKLERLVLTLYFGLEQDMPESLEQISHRLQVSPERVRQIKDMALGRLRHPSRMKILLDEG